MDGVIYTLNKLGETLSVVEQQLAQIKSENEVLRARIAELEREQSKSKDIKVEQSKPKH